MAVLQSIRNKSWLLLSVVGLGLLAFIFMDLGSYLGQNDEEMEIGSILEEKIMNNEFQKEIGLFEMENNGRVIELTDKDNIWNSFVQRRVFENEFDKLGLFVSEDEWNSRTQPGAKDVPLSFSNRFPNSTEGQNFFNNILPALPKEDPRHLLKKQIEHDLKMEKYNSLISNAMYATNIDVQNTLSESSQNATFKYLEFDLTSQAFFGNITPSEKEVKNYYNKYKSNYPQEASKQIEYVIFTPIASKKDSLDVYNKSLNLVSKLQNKEYDYRDFGSATNLPYVYTAIDYDNVNYNKISQDFTNRDIRSDAIQLGSGDYNKGYQMLLERFGGSPQFLQQRYSQGNSELVNLIKQQKEESRRGLTQEQWENLFNAEVGFVTQPYLVTFPDGKSAYRISKVVDAGIRNESVNIRHILLNYPDEKSIESINDRIDSIKLQIEQGAEFASFANLSDDKFSKDGELGWLFESSDGFTLDTSFNESCFTSEKGDLLIVKKQTGVHLIEILDVSKKVKKSKIVYIDRLINYGQEQFNLSYKNAIDFTSQFQKGKKSFSSLAKTFNKTGVQKYIDNVSSTDHHIEKSQEIEVDNTRSIVVWLEKDAKVGDVKYFKTENNNGDIVVVHFTKVIKKGNKSLKSIKEEISQQVIIEKRAQQISDKIKGISLDDIVDSFNFPINIQEATITFSDQRFSEKLVGSVFSGKVSDQTKICSAIDYTEDQTASSKLYVFQVMSIDSESNEFSDEQIAGTKKNIKKKMMSDMNSIEEILKSNANVVDNRIQAESYD